MMIERRHSGIFVPCFLNLTLSLFAYSREGSLIYLRKLIGFPNLYVSLTYLLHSVTCLIPLQTGMHMEHGTVSLPVSIHTYR